MESYLLLLFLVEFLPPYVVSLAAHGDEVLESGRLLASLVAKMKSFPKVLSEQQCDGLLSDYKRCVALSECMDIQTPETHLNFHMFVRAVWQGNPWSYHTFADESENKQLKKALRLVHQQNFESRALVKYRELARRAGKQRAG